MRILIFSFIFCAAFGTSLFAHAAAKYTPITGFPGLDGNNLTTEDYVKALYMLSITVAGTLAVVKIIFSGVKYMLSDVITKKGDALRDIRGSLFGILIIMGAYLILNTINPSLTRLNVFGNAPALSPITTWQTSDEATQQVTTDYTNVLFTSASPVGSAARVQDAKDCTSQGGFLTADPNDPSIVECRSK